MNRSLPPLNALRAFEAAARHLSFTRAAEELNVTQAAISHQVKGLEDRLGVALFRRFNRALMLTDEGQRLLPAVRDGFDQIAAAVRAVKDQGPARALTVSVLPSFAAKWLVPRIGRFQERNPDIDLRVLATERLTDLLREGVDVAVRFGAGRWPGVRADFIRGEAVAPVCAPALRPSLNAPADLAHATLLHELMEPLAFPSWATWLEAAGVDGVDVSRGLRFSHSHILLQAAMDGRGVALAQLVLAADDIAAGRLVEAFDLRLPTGYGYYVVYPRSAAQKPKVQAFRDWILDEMAEQ